MAAILSRPQCVNIYHFYTSDVFYTDVYHFTFVVPNMYQWQVRNDFNKDVSIYISFMACMGPMCPNKLMIYDLIWFIYNKEKIISILPNLQKNLFKIYLPNKWADI